MFRAAAKPGIGKQTVERMIAESTSSTRRNFVLGGSALGAAGLIGGAWLYKRKSVVPSAPVASGITPAEIVKAHGKAVVFVEAAWKLIDIETGRQLYHLHLDDLPVFIDFQGKREPLLIDDDQKGKNEPIGRALAASGFVVHQDGFILTNQHVAASWAMPYSWGPGQKGLLYPDGKVIEGLELPWRWVPANTKSVVIRGPVKRAQLNQRLTTEQNRRRALQGRHDFLRVVFPDTSVRIPARLAKNSTNHDVALIKIDVTEALHYLEMDDQQEVKAGEPVVVLGYPAISSKRSASIRPRDAFRVEWEESEVPGLTVSTGNIGKITLDKSSRAASQDYVISEMGDSYQLTVNSAGEGNSGGPVFDTRGKVVGIFYAYRKYTRRCFCVIRRPD